MFTNTSTTESGPSMEELLKMMKSPGPPPKRMYLVPEEPFQFRPIEIPVSSPFENEVSERMVNFKAMANYSVSIKADTSAFLKGCFTAREVMLGRVKVPNKSLRIVCLVVTVIMFLFIWSGR